MTESPLTLEIFIKKATTKLDKWQVLCEMIEKDPSEKNYAELVSLLESLDRLSQTLQMYKFSELLQVVQVLIHDLLDHNKQASPLFIKHIGEAKKFLSQWVKALSNDPQYVPDASNIKQSLCDFMFEPQESDLKQSTKNSRRKILIIDDDSDIALYLCDMLSDEYDCTLAVTYPDAIEHLENSHFDIVLSDLNLQSNGKTGLDVIKYIKKKSLNIRFIMITGAQTSQLQESLARKEGCLLFLNKPFEQFEVKFVLKQLRWNDKKELGKA